MSPEELNNLLRAPTESLAVEFKSWLDVKTDADRAKVARALIALRNNNGGVLVLGFDDKTLKPAATGRPKDLATAYHPDEMQRIVKDYAGESFEVKVTLATRDEKSYPVFTVGEGVTEPVLTRRDGVKLRQYAVYVRSVQNGVVESTEPRSPADWKRLLEICFDNREANVARFFQRNLVGIAREMRNLPSTGSPLDTFFDESAKHFEAAVAHRQKSAVILPAEPVGWQETAVVVKGELRPTRLPALLDTLFPHQPQLSGWPIWIDSRQLKTPNQPHVNQGGWEALVKLKKEGFFSTPLVDFWRIEPARLYHRRIFEDDLRVNLGELRGKVLDYVVAIERVAEALAVARAFARERVIDPEKASILIRLRWTALRGRRFLSWSNPSRDLFVEQTAYQDEVSSEFEMPLAVTRAGLVPFVVKAVEPLFEAFGSNLAQSLGQEIGERILRRRGE